MTRKHALTATAFALLLSGPLCAQDTATQGSAAPPMTPEMQAMMEAYQKAGTPGAEHRKLAAMAGDYDLTVKAWHAPDAPPTTDAGSATRKMILGDRVMVEEVSSQMMGQPYSGQGLHGFDNVTGKYWATWSDSMSTGLMVSEGSCDADMACTLAVTGRVSTLMYFTLGQASARRSASEGETGPCGTSWRMIGMPTARSMAR